MPKLDREQAISVAALALLLLLCVSMLGLLLQARSDAAREASNGAKYSRASKPSCGQFQIGRPQWRHPPHSSMLRPRASRVRSCSHIWRNWPTTSAPTLFHQGEKLPSATTHLIRSAFRPRLI